MIVRVHGAEPYNPVQAVTLVTESGSYRYMDPDDVLNVLPGHVIYIMRMYRHEGKTLEVIHEIVPWEVVRGIRLEYSEPSESVWKKVPLGSSMPLYFPDERPSEPKTNLN